MKPMTSQERRTQFLQRAQEWLVVALRAKDSAAACDNSADRRVWEHLEAGAKAQQAFYLARLEQASAKP